MRLVLCEGKHATTALQGILSSAFACTTGPAQKPDWYNPRPSSGEKLLQLRSHGNSPIFVHAVGGKPQLNTAIRLRLGIGRLVDTELIGVCFDPDQQTEADWRQSIESQITAAGFQPQRMGWHYIASGTPNGPQVIPLPWLSPDNNTPTGLPDVQSLYRVTAQALALAFPSRAPLVDEWTRKAWELGARPDWKTVCWFWMAGWHSEAECDHFFREAFTLNAIHLILQGSPQSRVWWDAIGLVAQ